MNLLEETFAAHEHLAPDSAEVLREVRRRTAHRRHVASRTLAVAAVGATVAAVAVGSVVLGGADVPRAAERTTQAATHHPTPTASATPSGSRLPGPDHTTFGAGWLPGAQVTVVLASNSLQQGQELEYVMSVVGRKVTVIVQYGPTWDTQSKTGPAAGKLGTFGGHPSQTWDSGGYWKLEYRRDATHVAIVEVIVGDKMQGSGAAAIGEHVARDLRFDLDTPIGVGGYLTHLPDGVHLSAVTAQDKAVSWRVTADGSHSEEGLIEVEPSDGTGGSRVINLDGSKGPGFPRGKPGNPVQGYKSFVDQHGASIVLSVPELLPGKIVRFLSSPAVPTLDELYAVAGGLRRS